MQSYWMQMTHGGNRSVGDSRRRLPSRRRLAGRRRATSFYLANEGHDTRAIQH
jgi:hypothetical protein